MDNSLKDGGSTGFITPATAMLNAKLAGLSRPRDLTPEEIELLRKAFREMSARFREKHMSRNTLTGAP